MNTPLNICDFVTANERLNRLTAEVSQLKALVESEPHSCMDQIMEYRSTTLRKDIEETVDYRLHLKYSQIFDFFNNIKKQITSLSAAIFDNAQLKAALSQMATKEELRKSVFEYKLQEQLNEKNCQITIEKHMGDYKIDIENMLKRCKFHSVAHMDDIDGHTKRLIEIEKYLFSETPSQLGEPPKKKSKSEVQRNNLKIFHQRTISFPSKQKEDEYFSKPNKQPNKQALEIMALKKKMESMERNTRTIQSQIEMQHNVVNEKSNSSKEEFLRIKNKIFDVENTLTRLDTLDSQIGRLVDEKIKQIAENKFEGIYRNLCDIIQKKVRKSYSDIDKKIRDIDMIKIEMLSKIKGITKQIDETKPTAKKADEHPPESIIITQLKEQNKSLEREVDYQKRYTRRIIESIRPSKEQSQISTPVNEMESMIMTAFATPKLSITTTPTKKLNRSICLGLTHTCSKQNEDNIKVPHQARYVKLRRMWEA